jgi:hypothetical protein
LSELLDEVAREPVQVEVSAVRVLFELLGFLLKTKHRLLSVFSSHCQRGEGRTAATQNAGIPDARIALCATPEQWLRGYTFHGVNQFSAIN